MRARAAYGRAGSGPVRRLGGPPLGQSSAPLGIVTRMPEPERAPIPVPRPTHPWFGKTIARCTIGEKLGRGVTSHVSGGLYAPLNKEHRRQDPRTATCPRPRSMGEALPLSRRARSPKVNHEKSSRSIDVVEDQGHFCILMELVSGPTPGTGPVIDDETHAPAEARAPDRPPGRPGPGGSPTRRRSSTGTSSPRT